MDTRSRRSPGKTGARSAASSALLQETRLKLGELVREED